MRTATIERNREIFAAYETGQSPVVLAAKYGLSVATLTDLITAEKHRRAVSVEGFYKVLRHLNPPVPFAK